MSADLDRAYERAREATERLQRAYRNVFDARASKEDQLLVKNDLEAFCNVRTDMLRPTAHATAHELGKFRVWQRITGFRFPRPPDAKAEFKVTIPRDGGKDGQEDERRAAGPGVAEPTDD